MIEVKVQCDCGQRFKFDVEPVNGSMPYEVKCPICGVDGTQRANAVILEKLAAETPTPSPAPGLRLRREPGQAVSGAPPVPAPVAPRQFPIQPAVVAPKAKASVVGGFLKGVAGALVASLVGMFGWYLLIKATGYEIGYAAWGVGALTGLGARVVGAESSQKLGIVAGLFALVAIIGGEFLAVRSVAENEFDKIALLVYQERLDEANTAVALASPEETKAFVARKKAKAVADVTAEDLQEFRDKELPRHRDFVAGKSSKAQFIAGFNHVKNSFGVQLALLRESIGWFTLLWIILGVGSAFKLGAGTDD